ncbi:DUF6745 domain-containing protein [Kitasatospora sp. NPDC059571]|uniref:DUF6745 domain-containing protein n=1 Tax=Kitasatospora sp. NPDC059571 TaxID=3346871 RepID=UPI0036951791
MSDAFPIHPGERAARACAARDEWLAHGLSTLPADRDAAEEAVVRLYRLVGAPPPRFVWVDSPAQARTLIAGGRGGFPGWRVSSRAAPPRADDWPLAARLASLTSDLRSALDDTLRIRPWPSQSRWTAGTLTPDAALAAGIPLESVIGAAAVDPLEATLRDAVCAPVRTALVAAAGSALGHTWHGQHDAYWVGGYDAHRSARGTVFRRGDAVRLDLFAVLARSTGWWWPAEGRCVMADRPAALHTEPLPHGLHGERRLHHDDGPAVRYRDGAEVYALHGTHVPAWVLTGPTVERIHAERNVEIRRCAIERIGWDTYVDRAELRLLSTAPDPGNPGSELRLYDAPRQPNGPATRLLVAVNGSVEPDGRRRRYGLSVPPHFDDAVAAAGWSYGLSGDQYARLARRT